MDDLSKYRGNSHKAKGEPLHVREKVSPVVTRPPVRIKPGLWTRFRTAIIGEDAREVGSSVFMDVVIPSIKDLLFDIITEGSSRTLYGGTSPRGADNRYRGGGRTIYNKVSNRPQPRDRDESPRLDRRARALHDFSDLVFTSMAQAESVIKGLYERIDQYGEATVMDFYELAGLDMDFTDEDFGWRSIHGNRIRRRPRQDGYSIELPRPINLKDDRR